MCSIHKLPYFLEGLEIKSSKDCGWSDMTFRVNQTWCAQSALQVDKVGCIRSGRSYYKQKRSLYRGFKLSTFQEVMLCFMKTRDRKPQLMGHIYYHLAFSPTQSTGIIFYSYFHRSYILLFPYHGRGVHISNLKSSRTTSLKSTSKRGRSERN